VELRVLVKDSPEAAVFDAQVSLEPGGRRRDAGNTEHGQHRHRRFRQYPVRRLNGGRSETGGLIIPNRLHAISALHRFLDKVPFHAAVSTQLGGDEQ
jgi:hypothetical protein